MWYEARSLHYRFYRFNLVWPPCVLLMIYVRNVRNVSLNDIGCVTKCGPAGILEKPTDRCKASVLKSSYRKIWSNILAIDKTSTWATKWIKNRKSSTVNPSVDLIRVKNMYVAPFLWVTWVLCACIEHKVSLEAFKPIEAALVSFDNNMIIPWWLTDHHNC